MLDLVRRVELSHLFGIVEIVYYFLQLEIVLESMARHFLNQRLDGRPKLYKFWPF